MRFSTMIATLLPIGAALAQGTLWNVVVGNGSSLTFSPSTINASVGDTIQFIFASKNHSATQSTFAAPCTAMANGFNTGFMPVPSSVTTNSFPGNNSALPAWNYSVTNTSAPLWFFCAQTNPVDHCQSGMVFAVNAPASGNKTFDAFQQAAKDSNATTGSTGSGSYSAAGTVRVGTAGMLLGGVGLVALLL